MKRITKAILIALSVIFILSIVHVAVRVAGFSFPTFPVPSEKYRQLHDGMTRAEVVGLIGEPHSKSKIAGPGKVTESWEYGGSLRYFFGNSKGPGDIVVVQFDQNGSVIDHWSED
jgi:outer membrane protein assembly factor BamE (lipoprotein component of BamABCDE complex)